MVIELLTGLLVAITAFYAWVTYRMLQANERVVESMREQSESIYRPYISVTPILEPDNPVFYLRIANLGKTSATDVQLNIDRSFFKFGERTDKSDLASFSIFNNKIDSLPPETEIVFSLAQGFVVFEEGADPTTCPKKFTITSKYKFGTKTVEETHIVDLNPFCNSDVPQDPIVRKLRAINESINKLTVATKSSS